MLQNEPTAVAGIIKVVAMVAAFFGIALTDNEQQTLAIAIGAGAAAISVVATAWNRQKTWGPVSHEKAVTEALNTPAPGQTSASSGGNVTFTPDSIPSPGP